MGSLVVNFSNMLLLLLIVLLQSPTRGSNPTSHEEAFIRCFTHQHIPYNINATYQLIHIANSPSFNSTLLSSINNPRFLNSTSTPTLIVSPTHGSHVQAAVVCARRQSLRIRTRSGGHDFAGLSYRSLFPHEQFVLLDLAHLRSVHIDLESRTAWVEAGATLGELYYEIARHSRTLGFPAGVWPTIGIGGHISGGGAGTLIRKYGLASDNVVDALIVDASGQVFDRSSMGEDLFWAIRGGGGTSFGIILSFKLNLVDVPSTVTVFTVAKTLKQGAAKLVTKWQHIASTMVDDLYLSMVISPNSQGKDDLLVSFQCLFLGNTTQLLPIMDEHFPELDLRTEDCQEMSWIESVLYHATYNDRPIEDLLDRRPQLHLPFKPKYDFVEEPILEKDWEEILQWLLLHGNEVRLYRIEVDALGARMNEIPESATPYPHRKPFYKLVYIVLWKGGEEEERKHVEWIRRFYEYMAPYVSKNPRGAYVNVKDLDLGWNKGWGRSTYLESKVWAERYFKGNFERLARVKGKVDPENYFWSEQSVPPPSQ